MCSCCFFVGPVKKHYSIYFCVFEQFVESLVELGNSSCMVFARIKITVLFINNDRNDLKIIFSDHRSEIFNQLPSVLYTYLFEIDYFMRIDSIYQSGLQPRLKHNKENLFYQGFPGHDNPCRRFRQYNKNTFLWFELCKVVKNAIA